MNMETGDLSVSTNSISKGNVKKAIPLAAEVSLV